MCKLCLEACNEHWPHLTNEQRRDLLWGATSFPAGGGESIAEQVRVKAEQSGGDLEKALWIADQEMEFCVRNTWRYIWPRQYVGVSDFDLLEIRARYCGMEPETAVDTESVKG